MKKLFVETAGYSMVVFADENGMCYCFHEESFDEPLTLEVAKKTDYSNCDGCNTAEEIKDCIGTGEVYNTDEILSGAESVTDIHLTIKEIRALTGLSQMKFGEKYHIPYRTIQNWEVGLRECPEYVVEFLEFKVFFDCKNN